MLGSTLFRLLSASHNIQVLGTARHKSASSFFPAHVQGSIIQGLDVTETAQVKRLLEKHRPDLVINCIGAIKQKEDSKHVAPALTINSILPHLLAETMENLGGRLLLIGTDCVFTGQQGNYSESDPPDARDLYGLSKYLGEIADSTAVLTLRTSIIGHEINTSYSLLEWFLAQRTEVKGYERAFFSGVTTLEIGKFIQTQVLPGNGLHGLYHLAAERISKLELLKKIRDIYEHHIRIVPDANVEIDRSLNPTRLFAKVNYRPPDWNNMLRELKLFNLSFRKNNHV